MMKNQWSPCIQWKGFEDEREIRDAYWQVSSDDVIIDVGCHVGSYTIPALEAGATVYAVDPYPSYTNTLRKIAGNTDKLIVVSAALSEEGGYPEELRDAMVKMPWNTLFAPFDSSAIPDMYKDFVYTVKYLTLDALVDYYKITKISFIKIDVEGAELSVLHGGMQTLSKFKPQIIIEDHTDVYEFVKEMNIRQQCLQLLSELDYTVELVPYKGHESSDRTFLICSRKINDFDSSPN